MSITLVKAPFPDLGKEQCIVLTTFRKTGQAVTTPVWFAQSPGTIYVETHADAGKLKRLRHTTRVMLAPCTYSGKVTGAAVAGNARILTALEECAAASKALTKKYGVMRSFYHFARNVGSTLHRKGKIEVVYIAIDPIID
jgi:PPOX class probable F420-dependent enzyme